jgi:hypothetical protein
MARWVVNFTHCGHRFRPISWRGWGVSTPPPPLGEASAVLPSAANTISPPQRGEASELIEGRRAVAWSVGKRALLAGGTYAIEALWVVSSLR